jgi:N-acetylmuramoyl-L-alanine amidase
MKLELLVLHCTATPEGRIVTPEDIKKWHLSPIAVGGRGWRQVGYSDMILLNGKLVNLVPYDENDEVERWEITNGAVGINGRARHIVYVGGMDVLNIKPKDTRNEQQLNTMVGYIYRTINMHPNIKIAGHNQFASKACPSFNVPEWLYSIGIELHNIYENNTVSA